MNAADYNFNPMISALSVLKNTESGLTNNAKTEALETVKTELNAFFMDFTCVEVIYTINTDKPMFGLFVEPIWHTHSESVLATLLGTGDDITEMPYIKYKVEIDSKLLDMISPAELCAIMVNDINELCTSRSIKAITNAIDVIMAYNDDTVDEKMITETFALFKMAVEITLHNITSALTREYEDVICSELLKGYKLAPYFESGIITIFGNDIASSSLKVYNPAIVLNWYFMVYKDAKTGRYVGSILQKSLTMDGSTLVKKAAMRALESITVVSDRDAMYFDSITEAVVKKKKGLIAQMKRNGLKSLEEDLYEYGMRLRNVETQDDAILLMRQLNSRMSILEDYLNYEEIDEDDRRRWMEVYHQYQEIRAELSKKTVYNRKMYGLFVDYNALAQMDKKSQGQILQSYY